jgi:hypothetical protein
MSPLFLFCISSAFWVVAGLALDAMRIFHQFRFARLAALGAKFSEAGNATSRMHAEAGRAVAVQFACIEESPGSTEQDAG